MYTVRFLPIGSYKVTVEANGFATQAIGPFSLEIDQTAKVDATLKTRRFRPPLRSRRDISSDSRHHGCHAGKHAIDERDPEYPAEWPEFLIPDALPTRSHRHRSKWSDRQQRHRAEHV